MDDPTHEEKQLPAADRTVELLYQQLREGVEVIESGADWRAWLDFARHFHRYSFNNLVLIWRQRPDASSVASYRTWQSVDRQVRRGEHALRVLAPVLRRSIVLDSEGRATHDEEGKPRRRQQVVGFRPVAVFDISQTEGPPIPHPPSARLLTGPAPASLWDALAREVSERGYRLLRTGAEQLGGANGVTKVATREVVVRGDVDDAQAVKTLAHELAHVVLHAGTDDASEAAVCTGVREVEAESVAFLVLAAHGLASDGYSFPYVASWAHPLAAAEGVPVADVVARTGTRVMNTARGLIDATAAQTVIDETTAGALLARVTDSSRRTQVLLEKTVSVPQPRSDRAVLLAVLADSQEFLRRAVRSSWVPNYLRERGLSAALDSHEIGYAPKQWTVLTDHLRRLGYSDAHIEDAGVASRSQNGHLIDHLRDRLVVPLRDLDGDLVGFTGRVNPARMTRADEPRYLNTRTTAVFRKGELLYGLAEHQEQIRGGATPVLCEGPLDAIAVDLLANDLDLPLAGVASVGTAYTADQSRQLQDLAGSGTICLAFDADSAGRAATEKAWRILTADGPRAVTGAVLPPGSDPASLLAETPHLLRDALVEARPVGLVLATRTVADAHISGNVAAELVAFRDLAKLATRMPPNERPGYLLQVAELLRIEVGDAAVEVAERHPHLLEERQAGPRTLGREILAEHLRQGETSRLTTANAVPALTLVSARHVGPS